MRREATVKVRVGGERVIATAEGNGPVNALDQALRQALGAALPGAGRARAGRLQGPHPGGHARHRRRHPRARRDPRRSTRVDHGRRARERHRGVLAGAGGRGGVRPAACRPTADGWLGAGSLTAVRSREVQRPGRRRRSASSRATGGEELVSVDRRPPVRRRSGSSGAPAAARPTCGCSRRCCPARSSRRPQLRRPRQGDGRRGARTSRSIFLKPSTSVIGPERPDPYPGARPARCTTRASSPSSSAGSCREVPDRARARGGARLHLRQRRHRPRPAAPDAQWTRAKGFDTFCPLGPWIETDAGPVPTCAIDCRGQRRPASGRRAPRCCSAAIAELIAYVSACHDPAARGRDPHRHTRRRRPDRRRRHGDGRRSRASAR